MKTALLVKLVIIGGLMLGLLTAILAEQKKRRVGVLDTVKATDVKADHFADEFKNYKQ